jgi:16S rRNA (cytidine1402-2'-O)-methyltransferase
MHTDQPRGTLFLIPVPLGANQAPDSILPPATISAACALTCFIAENAKTARAVLKGLPLRQPIQSLEITELNEHTTPDQLPRLLAPLLAGRSVGLLSEAGCPAVADPGGALVALAHRHGIRVVPLVGPSSLLLALMASGMSGQSFAFVGYLPVNAAERRQRIQALERRAINEAQTQILIETPYRNQALMVALLADLSPSMLLGVASDLTLTEECIRVAPVSQWRQQGVELARTPTVFTIAAPPAQAVSGPMAPRRRR